MPGWGPKERPTPKKRKGPADELKELESAEKEEGFLVPHKERIVTDVVEEELWITDTLSQESIKVGRDDAWCIEFDDENGMAAMAVIADDSEEPTVVDVEDRMKFKVERDEQGRLWIVQKSGRRDSLHQLLCSHKSAPITLGLSDRWFDDDVGICFALGTRRRSASVLGHV